MEFAEQADAPQLFAFVNFDRSSHSWGEFFRFVRRSTEGEEEVTPTAAQLGDMFTIAGDPFCDELADELQDEIRRDLAAIVAGNWTCGPVSITLQVSYGPKNGLERWLQHQGGAEMEAEDRRVLVGCPSTDLRERYHWQMFELFWSDVHVRQCIVCRAFSAGSRSKQVCSDPSDCAATVAQMSRAARQGAARLRSARKRASVALSNRSGLPKKETLFAAAIQNAESSGRIVPREWYIALDNVRAELARHHASTKKRNSKKSRVTR